MMQILRRTILGAILALLLIGPAAASERVPFTQQAFDEAMAAGVPILVHVTAEWCETCHVQIPIVAELTARPDLAQIVIFNVDFDTQKDVANAFKVQFQGSMIVFRAGREVDRAVGITDPGEIEMLLRQVC